MSKVVTYFFPVALIVCDFLTTLPVTQAVQHKEWGDFE